MLLEDIEKEWAIDSVISNLKLDNESLKIPKLHSKYYSYLINEKLVHVKIKKKLEEREYVLEQFYKKTLTVEELNEHKLPLIHDKKILTGEIPRVIANQPDIIELKTKLSVQSIKIDFLDSIMKTIHNRNWVIRDAIEWRKFENGGN